MKKVLGFYRTFFQTLNPGSYEGFAESRIKNTLNYFFSLVFNALIIFAILMIPAILSMPDTLQYKLDNVNTFKVTTDFSTNKPILFPEKNPVVLINYANETPTQSANIILNNNILYVGAILKNYEINLNGYGDVKAHKENISTIITILLVLMLPTLALIAYFYLLIKYFVFVLIASIIVAIIGSIFSYRTEFKHIFSSAMYGISLSIFLDLIFRAVSFEFYYIQYLPLLIYTFCGVTAKGTKIDSKKKNRYVEVKERF